MEEAEASIVVRDAYKQYTKKGKFILDGLNMTVHTGTIYGLLGASGCGKTTLLSAIVGTRKIQSGMIRVFGQAPGRSAVKVIGYMPQDIALVGEFSVKGALQHYGWIFGMTDDEIDQRFVFLSKLLDLPPKDKLIKHLSGGQQRRVSLAVVLVHNPKLLILDEPTVGLDPVLRQRIWDYLVKLAEVEKKTIIITTHYIEEANQAHQLGLLRNGKILAEGAPQELMETYNCSNIESVFLILSRRQQEGYFNRTESKTSHLPTESLNIIPKSQEYRKSLCERFWFTNRGHSKALLSKNFLRFKRHPGTLMFAFLFPFLQMSTFFLAVGRIPNDLSLGIVNDELGNYTDCNEYKSNNIVGGYFPNGNSSCVYNGLGCKFVESIGGKIKKVYYRSVEEAIEAMKLGEVHNFIHFASNYSETVTQVRNLTVWGDLEDDSVWDFQQINVYRDVIDHSLSDILMKEVYDSYKKYKETLASDCSLNPNHERIPMRFNEPVYGSEDLTYRDLITPGMIALVAVFLTMGLSTSAITTERTEGIWERTIVAGVTPAEILIFHTVTIACVSVFQILEIFLIAFIGFEFDCKGDKIIVFLLVFVQSIAGICFGITISVITKTVSDANYASLGLFYPFITLTGCFWPIEGMPDYLQYLSYFVPLTITSQSLSNVMHRGWGLDHFHVLKGILASLGFILFFTLTSISVLRHERKK